MQHDETRALFEAIHETIHVNRENAPTEPGVYLMPCGECIVDFFVTADGEEHWLVPGEEQGYTRQTINLTRHGDQPWRRLYSLEDAAAAIVLKASSQGAAATELLEKLARSRR